MNIQDLISISILLLQSIPLILFLITRKTYHLIIFIVFMSVAKITDFIKDNEIISSSRRPNGAFNCNLLCNDGSRKNKPGMPSSHAASAIFFLIVYWNYTSSPYIRALLVIYYLLILQSRYYKKCHSLSQLLVGSLIGMAVGFTLNHYKARLL